MASNTETAVLYNLQNTETGRKLKLILLQMKVRIRHAEPSGYLQPVGILAGVRDLAATDSVYEGDGFQEPMLLLRGFTDSRLNSLLSAMRRAKVSVPLKAVLTAENQNWNSLELYEELKKEHRAFQQQ